MSGAHAAIAAAERKRKMEREEEQLAGYSAEDLKNWEFKIVRSTTNAFSKDAVFYQVLEEEAIAGWDLLEKLDNGRIRFKRPVSARRRDALLPPGIRPYRTRYGISEGQLAFSIMSIMFAVIGMIVLVVYLVEGGF